MNVAIWLQVFLEAAQEIAPLIEAIHPNNATEATKINTGVAIAGVLAKTTAAAVAAGQAASASAQQVATQPATASSAPSPVAVAVDPVAPSVGS